MISRLMLHLLPVQIMFALIGSVNAIVSSYFATNYIGIRMVYKLAKDVTYQNVLGLNVLTLKL